MRSAWCASTWARLRMRAGAACFSKASAWGCLPAGIEAGREAVPKTSDHDPIDAVTKARAVFLETLSEAGAARAIA